MTSDKLGRQLKDLRISVTDRCNFRCPYCMPSEIYGDRYQFLPKDDLLTFEEITRLASIFANLGVNKIRITGGEPLVRNSVEELIANLSYIPEIVDLTMTTNGYLLPQKAQLLKNYDHSAKIWLPNDSVPCVSQDLSDNYLELGELASTFQLLSD